jgi:glucokinase
MPSTIDRMAIGIDVGGTQVRAGVIDSSGRILARRRWSYPRGDSAEVFAKWIVDAVTELRDQVGACSDTSMTVGVALPGILDVDRGVVKRSINLPFLEGRPLGKLFTERTGLRCILVTDAEAATWGEYVVRTPRPRRFVHLRLGTGVACGVVIEGQLQCLDQDRATHLEVLIVERGPDAIACRCGLVGCLETIASGASLDALARQQGFAGGLGGLADACQSGDRRAQQVMQGAAQAIRAALGNLANKFRTDVICVGGGVVARLPWLVEWASAGKEIAGEVALTEGTPGHAAPIIQRARLGDDAGVIGAGLRGLKRG